MIGLLRSSAAVRRAFPGKALIATTKYLLRGSLTPWVTREWLAAIERNPALAAFVEKKPRMLLKPQRPYLNRTYDARARLDSLLAHYRFVDACLPDDLIGDLAAPHGRGVAYFTGGDGDGYTLRLCGTDRFDREGELLLCLERDLGRQRIGCLAFTVTGEEPARRLEIGCLQGAESGEGRELTRRATRDFHGVRPKNILLDAAYALASGWNIYRLEAVDNAARIYGNGLYGENSVFADYDAFWRELGGLSASAGRFQLPRALSHRTPEDVPSRRRAEYRRRAALRETLALQIHARLAMTPDPRVRAPAPSPPTHERLASAFAG